MIARLDLSAIGDLREVLPRFSHHPLPHLPHLKSDQRLAHWLDEITDCFADDSSIAFASIVSGIINGFVIYNDSPWDSRITARRIGTVKHLAVSSDRRVGAEILRELINELTRSLDKRGTECVVCKVQCDDFSVAHALEEQGFLLMDTLQDFVFDSSRTAMEAIDLSKRDSQLKIRQAKPADLPALMAINERAFAGYFGRYHADPQMPQGTATRIYIEWVRSAFDGWADWILVAELNDEIAGYGLWRKALKTEQKNSLRIAHYDLGATAPEFRSRGLRTALTVEGMRIARDFAQYLVGPVHVSNYPAQHTLHKLGWRISGARHAFHKWLKP
jgi:ribosomal protein S18 acetylase RimI-like enzyme